MWMRDGGAGRGGVVVVSDNILQLVDSIHSLRTSDERLLSVLTYQLMNVYE